MRFTFKLVDFERSKWPYLTDVGLECRVRATQPTTHVLCSRRNIGLGVTRTTITFRAEPTVSETWAEKSSSIVYK